MPRRIPLFTEHDGPWHIPRSKLMHELARCCDITRRIEDLHTRMLKNACQCVKRRLRSGHAQSGNNLKKRKRDTDQHRKSKALCASQLWHQQNLRMSNLSNAIAQSKRARIAQNSPTTSTQASARASARASAQHQPNHKPAHKPAHEPAHAHPLFNDTEIKK